MSSESRRAATNELLARVDALVSGHELQRTTEPTIVYLWPSLEDVLEWLRPANEAFARFGRTLNEMARAMSPALKALQAALDAMERPLRPVPAKSAHMRKFGRGR